ncbi:hypothetical protein DFS33DRAFT_138475 [Desarmillaria ectypa]|nr:hypothetical protein DFS33DRAFT_138475 [Desarmillaria ectypa]
MARPRFDPLPCVPPTENIPLSHHGSQWTPLITCPADFPLELFEIAIAQLVDHPEYNSTLILRSERLLDMNTEFPTEIPRLDGFEPTRCIHRRLLPRRPGRDAALEQYCTLYSKGESASSALVLTPLGSPLPYYHPAVSHLAFRYLKSEPATLRIEVLPLPDTPLDPNSRLYRTSLALLDTLHRYGWGAMTNYKKRVKHDNLIQREAYQDLYLIMREKHKHLVDTWQEATDPLKHVFEDIGIATFLMLLWKETYRNADTISNDEEESEPWPRPPGGFLDFGCGNGLLTHILISEGYSGCGIDLRARTSWSHYPAATQPHLHIHAFDPFSSSPDPFLKSGIFIIGNHADELTPWVPILSTLYSASGYLSIPCCPWSFDAKYDRSLQAPFPVSDEAVFEESLCLGGQASAASVYSMYRVWLASLSLHCGWKVECETLRIPSTRNWAIVGRQRIEDSDANEHVEDILQSVRDRGIFKPRQPEGKSKEDH